MANVINIGGGAGSSSGGSSDHNYSTTEQVVGTWIDGSDVYERVVEFNSAIEVGSNSWASTIIDTTNIDKIISVIAQHADGINYIGFQADPTLSSHTVLGLKYYASVNVKVLIIRYTKSSS